MRHHLPQSVGIVSFVSSLGGGAIIVWVVWQLSKRPMDNLEAEATVPVVQRSHQWTATLLSNLPVVFLLTAVVGSIGFVVYQTRFVR
jgi:hypothetical protein